MGPWYLKVHGCGCFWEGGPWELGGEEGLLAPRERCPGWTGGLATRDFYNYGGAGTKLGAGPG